MLVLNQQKDDKILIDGGKIEVVVLSIGQRHVRLGFKAPPDVDIVRDNAKIKTRKPKEN